MGWASEPGGEGGDGNSLIVQPKSSAHGENDLPGLDVNAEDAFLGPQQHQARLLKSFSRASQRSTQGSHPQSNGFPGDQDPEACAQPANFYLAGHT